ncbi:phosphoglycerate kinase [Chloroflexota bacterium]
MGKKTVRDIEVRGKRVLVRVDFNVPLDEKTGAISDDRRIQVTLPTIRYLIERGARVILCSHLGQPEGKVDDKLRLAPIGQHLAQLMGKRVLVTNDCIGPEVEKAVEELIDGDVLLLGNLRFYPDEETNNPIFAQALARLADIYVDDAFGTAHRRHASIVGITQYLPAVAGLLLEEEIKTLDGLLRNPAHPFIALLGGAKVSDKVGMLENIMDKVNYLLIGGGMAATFLKAKPHDVGLSLLEEDKLDTAAALMRDTAKNGVQLRLPVDVVIADKLGAGAKVKTVPVDKIPSDWRIVDIGPETIISFTEELSRCRTVFWNGPMGIYEVPQFARGTQAMAKLLASLDVTTIIGGGSTAELVAEMGLADGMTFVSTGGGASLKFLGGQALPGLEVLMDKEVSSGDYH